MDEQKTNLENPEPTISPALLAAIRDQVYATAKPVPKARTPWLSDRVRTAVRNTLALWPLLAINVLLVWVLRSFVDDATAEALKNIARVLPLALVALVFDVWLHPTQHPEALDGPAQGARQYQRIYLIAIFVVAGCLQL